MKLAALFFLSFTVCLRAAILTDAWSLNINDHTSVQRTYKQGESIDMRIILRNGLAPLDLTGATARFYWFTNTTANVWWTNSVTISAPKAGLVQSTWTPAMDTGAAMYYYWIGVWQSGSTSPLWRVTGNIRMLPSPGFTPNALPMPVRTLDFAGLSVTNAPWVTSDDWASGSNALSSALQTLATNTDARISMVTGEQAQASADLSAVRLIAQSALQPADTNGFLRLADLPSPSSDAQRLVNTNATRWQDGNGIVWEVTNSYSRTELRITFSDNFRSAGGNRPPVSFYPWSNGFSADGWSGSTVMGGFHIEGDGNIWIGGWAQSPDPFSPETWVLYPGTVYPEGSPQGTGSATIGYVDIYDVVTQAVDTVALKSDLSALPVVPTNAVSGWLLYDAGSNVWLQVSVSNLSFTVWEVH